MTKEIIGEKMSDKDIGVKAQVGRVSKFEETHIRVNDKLDALKSFISILEGRLHYVLEPKAEYKDTTTHEIVDADGMPFELNVKPEEQSPLIEYLESLFDELNTLRKQVNDITERLEI